MSGFQDNITDTVLDVQFNDISNLQEFNNKLIGIARNIQQPGGLFRVVNPARAVLNVDHFITGAWYVNGNVSVNLSSLSSNQWRLTELNLLTVTPRWGNPAIPVFICPCTLIPGSNSGWAVQ